MLHKERKETVKKWIVLLLAALMLLSLACAKGKTDTDANTTKTEEDTTVDKSHPIATITMKDGGVIQLELYPEVAPESVKNFISLANSGFYDGLIFHRVILGFMIQGGDPLGKGTGGPGYSIKGEFARNGVKNNLKHTRGVLSMARSMMPNSAGSQFFIMVEDAPHLDGQYAAFGKLVTGFDVADEIVNANRDRNDKPYNDQRMKTVTVETFGVDYPEPEQY